MPIICESFECFRVERVCILERIDGEIGGSKLWRPLDRRYNPCGVFIGYSYKIRHILLTKAYSEEALIEIWWCVVICYILYCLREIGMVV